MLVRFTLEAGRKVREGRATVILDLDTYSVYANDGQLNINLNQR